MKKYVPPRQCGINAMWGLSDLILGPVIPKLPKCAYYARALNMSDNDCGCTASLVFIFVTIFPSVSASAFAVFSLLRLGQSG
jgi:hypothetical protein